MDSRLSVWGALLALAHLRGSDLERALEEAERACERDHRTYMPRVALAAVHLARQDAAGAAAAMVAARQIKPDLSPAQIMALSGRRLGAALARLTP